MFLQKISFIWLLSNIFVISLPLYEINLQNAKVFEISSDNKDYDEQEENEMIQPEDLAYLKFDVLDESRYKPLHSYVDSYNKHESANKVQYINELVHLKPQIWEDSNIEEEDQPFIAGFKEDLDKMKNEDIHERVQRAEYNDEKRDFNSDEGDEGENDLIEGAEPGEEAYDYQKFKQEYEGQIAEDISSHNETLNDTKKEEPKEALKQIFNFTNCTEVSKKLGINAIDCLIRNYEQEKEKPVVKKTVSKVWLIIKVWFFIYIGLAIPCWCHRGWCCCCFRCKVCFPGKRINFAKKYYALNPPGTLAKEVKKKEEKEEFITYDPTDFEEDAYRNFEAAIRNI